MKLMNEKARTILLTLIKEAEPLISYHIALLSGLSPQITRYHLKKLEEANLVVSWKEDKYTFYFLNPIFYDNNVHEEILNRLEPVMKFVVEKGNLKKIEDNEIFVETVRSFLIVFLELFVEKLGEQRP